MKRQLDLTTDITEIDPVSGATTTYNKVRVQCHMISDNDAFNVDWKLYSTVSGVEKTGGRVTYDDATISAEVSAGASESYSDKLMDFVLGDLATQVGAHLAGAVEDLA